MPAGGTVLTQEELQEQQIMENSRKLGLIINELSTHIGHWSEPKQPSDPLTPGTNKYIPSLGFPQAVSDLKKILLPNGTDGSLSEASEEVARRIESVGLVQKHLAPLFVTIDIARYMSSCMHLSTIWY